MGERNSRDVLEERAGLTAGSVLEGRYRLDHKVGEGGHGVVFAGHHLTLDQPLAVKVVRLDDVSAELVGARAARFLDEARTLSKLRHSNVVRVLDVGIHSGQDGALTQAWLVMEWCGVRTLRDDLHERAGAPRSVAETWALLGPLVDAVAYAHKRGVVHRDIKPSNVMLVADSDHPESARLIDFGIAKSGLVSQGPTGWTRSTGPGVFTPGYAAPEQVIGVKTGPWTDVHALALVLTEVLVGRSAYGDDEVATIVAEARPTPARFGVDVGPWEEVLRRALSVRTTERFPDASEFYRALESSLAQYPQPSTSNPPSDKAPRSSVRLPEQPTPESQVSPRVTSPTVRTSEPSTPPLGSGDSTPRSKRVTPDSRLQTIVDSPSVIVAKGGPVLYVVWKPTVLDVRHVSEAFDALIAILTADRRRPDDTPLEPRWALLVCISKGAQLPDERVRKVIQSRIRHLDDNLVCGATIVEEPGLSGVAQRAVVSTLQLLSRPRHPEKTVARITDAAEFIVGQWRRARREELSTSEVLACFGELRSRADAPSRG
ncbi:MAG: serine/threonine-protein kinase [Polyangiaceae bacterium]